MNTKREQILAAVLMKLKTMTSVSASNVVRSRVDPFQIKLFPYVAIEPGPDEPESRVLEQTDWSLLLRVSVYQKGDIPDQAADPIVVELYNLLMSDRTLGGLLMDMEPGRVDPEFDLTGESVVKVTNEFILSYRTQNF